MDPEPVQNKCDTIIGFEHNFLEAGCPDKKLLAFQRDAKNLVIEGDHLTVPAGHIGLLTEVHLAAVIADETTEVTKETALQHVSGYVLALNSRLRESEYRPTTTTVHATDEFRSSVAISAVESKKIVDHPNALVVWMSVNGTEVQRAPISDGRFTVQELVEKASQLTTLRVGDLVLLGSPPGATYVKPGDTIEVGIEGILRSEFAVERASELATVVADPDAKNVF